jgi:hypothetical protein
VHLKENCFILTEARQEPIHRPPGIYFVRSSERLAMADELIDA